MLFIQHFAKDRPKPGCTAAITNCSLQMNEMANEMRFQWGCCAWCLLTAKYQVSATSPQQQQQANNSEASPQATLCSAKACRSERFDCEKRKRKKKNKEREKKGIYEELWLFGCHLPLIFRLICFWGLWVSLRWRICSKSIWWFCQDLYLKPYPLNYTAVTWQKDDWINEGLLQYSWFEKLENNTSLCPRESWLFH